MQVDGATKQRTDPSQAAGSTWLPMPLALEAGDITTPCGAETRARAGSIRFIFKDDRARPRGVLRRQAQPWVGVATPWSRAAPK
jgi:hypothetical protein